MINERKHIQDAIYDWVAAVVEKEGRTDPVIWDHDDGPRPEPPFISLEFVGCSSPGMADYGVDVDLDNPADDGVQTISRPMRRALTMYGFGEGAMDLLETIKASYEEDEYIMLLAEKGLVIPGAL
ncbi:MAG: hypothetical protein LBU82_06700, partial [Treponema sp.]|nr:hypothetical protein [Treponema sp.]